MGDVIRRSGRFYIRYVEGYRPAVNPDGTPKVWSSGPNAGKPKLDDDGKPLLEPVRKMRAAKGATTKEHAKRMLAEIERRIMHGKVGIEDPSPEQMAQKSISVRELGERFVTQYAAPKLKNAEKYRREARSILDCRVYPFLGDKPAATVTPGDVESMRDELTKTGAAGSSVMHALAKLSRIYTWGRKRGLIECANPVIGCERPRLNASTDFLSKPEVAQLLACAETMHFTFVAIPIARDLYPMVATAVFTGLRKGELFGLRWRDLHLDVARLDVMRSYRLTPKSGKARHLPLHPALVVILRAWKERCPATDEGLVFPVGDRMGTEWDTLGLEHLLTVADCHQPTDGHPWHFLRHTFASHFMMAGGNILTLQRLLGHADIKMTMRYAHLAPDFMAGEVARMSFAVSPAGVFPLHEARAASV